MQFFLDSAVLSEIEELSEWGLINGVTTNPTLISKQGLCDEEAIHDHYAKICATAPGNVSLEVIATETEEMLSEAHRLASISSKVIVKVPMTLNGLQAIRSLTKEGIRTNCTLIFTPLQALWAAKAGATYVSPFVGRLDDINSNSTSCIEDIKRIFEHYSLSTQILGASIRGTHHISRLAAMGVDVITCTRSVLMATLTHPLTDKGLEAFLSDYHNSIQHAEVRAKS